MVNVSKLRLRKLEHTVAIRQLELDFRSEDGPTSQGMLVPRSDRTLKPVMNFLEQRRSR